MLNLIKADFYRLLRSKGFYITILAAILYSLLIFFMSITRLESSGNVSIEQYALVTNLKETMAGMGSATTQLSYFAISLFVMIFGYEFSQQTYKNSLTVGISKLTFMLEKYLTCLLAFILITFVNFMTCFIAGWLKFGAGDTNVLKLFGKTIVMSIGNGLILSILFSVAMLVIILTHSTVSAIVFSLLYPAIIGSLMTLARIDKLSYISFLTYGIQLDEPSKASIPYAIIGVTVIVLSLLVSTLILKKKDL